MSFCFEMSVADRKEYLLWKALEVWVHEEKKEDRTTEHHQRKVIVTHIAWSLDNAIEKQHVHALHSCTQLTPCEIVC